MPALPTVLADLVAGKPRRPALWARSLALMALAGGLVGTHAACPGRPDLVPPAVVDDGGTPTTTPPAPTSVLVEVTVLLDGTPVTGATLSQAGRAWRVLTDAEGRGSLPVDLTLEGELYAVAAHPEARTEGALLDALLGQALDAGTDGPAITIELERFDPSDNDAYMFADPGEPKSPGNSSQCGHCHENQKETWFGSAHQTSGTRTTLFDQYLGVARFSSSEACLAAGGQWFDDEPRCRTLGVLALLNPGCAPDARTPDCPTGDVVAGACADCHTPGIDGVLGGRDLREAEGLARDKGVHCAVCHLVESVDLEAPAGVAGRLRIVRPSEPSDSPGLGDWRPLSFGPFDDVPSVVMGASPRAHFLDGTLCAGCHELHQPALAPSLQPDGARWPAGTLPVHTTYSEWKEGPYGDLAPCQSCHMPPLPGAWNAGVLGPDSAGQPGIVLGWRRDPGTVRSHSLEGPRTEGSRLLELAGALTLAAEVEGDVLTVDATVTNVGAGHGLPTGEPGRQVLLVVEARCGEERLVATGGDALDDLGGALDAREQGEDWLTWPGAEPGDVIRVVRRPGPHRDYDGYGIFASSGPLDAAARGWPVVEAVGEAMVVAVNGDAVTVEPALPEGDVAYRVRPPALPDDKASPAGWAGAPGALFAKVMAGPGGERPVPHFAAVDVVRDNRLKPWAPASTHHVFRASCPDPVVTAALLHRAMPFSEQRARGWILDDTPMTRATR